MTCKKPDHDNPKLHCGHPLPCPWHTAVIDMTAKPPQVRIPVTASAALTARERLTRLGVVLFADGALEE